MAKRGRPISRDTSDEAILRRRQQTAARMRRLREQQSNARTADAQQQSSQQIQQAETIIERPFEDQEAAETLLGLGLRVQNAVIAQDTGNQQLQQGAIRCNEPDAIYCNEDIYTPISTVADTASTTTTTTNRALVPQPGITRFFQTLPSQNPFATSAQTAQNTVDTPDALDIDEDRVGEQDNSIGERDAIEDRGLDTLVASNEQMIEDDSIPTQLDPDTSDGGEDESEISAHNYAVQKLYKQLYGGFQGYSTEQHEQCLQEHLQQARDNHHGLNDIFNDPTFPSVLGLPGMISAERLSRQETPSPAQWKAMFCGIPVPQEHAERQHQPINVCLHKEETQPIEPQVAFDIDSFHGFASSLAMASQGLFYQPAPLMKQNMSTDIHLESRIYQDSDDPEQPSRSQLAMLKNIPHFRLGGLIGAHDIVVYILFPHLPLPGGKFRALTAQQLSRWLDQIFHPAVYKYCEAHYTQHLPSSYRHALANSKAYQVEGRQIETASYQSQQCIGYYLQPEYLDQIWTDILGTIASTPGLKDFSEPQLFFSAKGTKLQFKTSPLRPSMLDAMENFQAYLQRIVDFDYVYLDQLYVDIGKEICPSISLLPTQRRSTSDEAQVYSWKRCCLERYLKWIYNGNPPAAAAVGQRYYTQNMLYEASSLTSVTPKRSKLRQGGLIYSQFYGSVKEISDASKCFPFDNDGLEEMALDPQIRQGAKNAAGGVGKDIKVLERAYCASKSRARYMLLDSRKKSFGVREEHRVSWSLFQGLISQLQLLHETDLQVILLECPSYVWSIKTEVYLNFLWRSADKFATGFEVVLAQCQRELVTWEQTKMMAMFLRCLRFVFGGHRLQRESALWWSRRERTVGQPPQQHVWYGLGFCNSLPRHGYCWIEPRINWNQLMFKSSITDNVLFGNSMLRKQYIQRGGQVQDFFDASRQLDLAMQWLLQYSNNNRIRERLLGWMAYICLHQFRLDILNSIKAEIHADYRAKAMQEVQPFCYEYLTEILTDRMHLVSGNRSDYKQVSDLGHFLFNFGDGRIRKHWDDKPFRKLYQRGRLGLDMQYSEHQLGARFSKLVFRKLYAYHWVLPYPSMEVFTQTTKQGQRMWYSIEPQVTVIRRGLQQVRENEWHWSRKEWRTGAPSAVPGWTQWDKGQWKEWIEREVVRANRN
jgi:hypothetical protein